MLEIILADDDSDDCHFFKKALEELSVSASLKTFHDGEHLMDYLQEKDRHLPSVIFLDINMPRKNGVECLSEIKQNKHLSEIPIVMFSTSNEWDIINMLFQSGAHVYIHKPKDFSQLKQVIYHALPIALKNTYSSKSLKYVLNA